MGTYNEEDEEDDGMCDGEVEDVEKMLAVRKEKMKKFGWIVDNIAMTIKSGGISRTMYNVHTHGLKSKGHPELQMYSDNPSIAVISKMGKEVMRENVVFKPSHTYRGYHDFKRIRLVEAKDRGVPVLRIIVADEQDRVHKSLMSKAFSIQYENLNTDPNKI